mmetsp:Transcript_5173/g.9838  ORF Transcript_5173/g.9838 Transcript_5173/m.9838 type:complete len:221 (+) Transcript_5173:164-826(+)|eukprot:CAMPEP_0114255270 /NCGR_PEP_ID=MMETSP0058-20121206/17459_1 /TAXON_ID=36894 /ORGANISM="Pyramimonas parkeae, CCMP726" /LENGTH=220 /DNA_ID=CAMNT_0001369617 /DNA_START=73 /DNA_END=735 /DNA_ORIENTATION=+
MVMNSVASRMVSIPSAKSAEHTLRVSAGTGASTRQGWERTGVELNSSRAVSRGAILRIKLRSRSLKSCTNNRVGLQCVSAGLIDLPTTYGCVAWTAAASYLLVTWQGVQVALARREYDVQYPKMYEDKEDSIFNCYQRAHQNTLESYPAFLTLLVLGGLGYPLISSASGMVWIVGRVVYSKGYYTGDPSNRMQGAWNNFGIIALWTCTIMYGFKQLDLLP